MHQVSGVSSPPPPAPSTGSSSFMTPPALYISLYPYKPQKADELELRKGALYTVSEKCQDGWFKGSSVRTQKVGVFPGNYVQAVRSQPHPLVNPPAPMTQSTPSCVPSRNGGHPPPKLPPRALSPASGSPGMTVLNAVRSGGTSSSASVPAAVVARLATTPAPAPALSPRATTLINPPPNMVVGAEAVSPTPVAQVSVDKKEKDKPGVSLMKRLTSRKKSSPPLLHPYSIDNPVFEDGHFSSAAAAGKPTLAPPAAPVHVRYFMLCFSECFDFINIFKSCALDRDLARANYYRLCRRQNVAVRLNASMKKRTKRVVIHWVARSVCVRTNTVQIFYPLATFRSSPAQQRLLRQTQPITRLLPRLLLSLLLALPLHRLHRAIKTRKLKCPLHMVVLLNGILSYLCQFSNIYTHACIYCTKLDWVLKLNLQLN